MIFHCLIPRPNHCGRHLGKINGHKSIYVLTWRCIQDEFDVMFMQPCLNKFMQSQGEVCIFIVNAKQVYHCLSFYLPKLSINHSQTELLLTGRSFKLTSSPWSFERRAVTSPTTLVSKGRHCHWDYLISWAFHFLPVSSSVSDVKPEVSQWKATLRRA